MEKQKNGNRRKPKIILSRQSLELFEKKLLLGKKVRVEESYNISSTIPIGVDDDGDMYVPRDSVPDEKYSEYVLMFTAIEEYARIVEMINYGEYAPWKVDAPVLEYRIRLGDMKLGDMADIYIYFVEKAGLFCAGINFYCKQLSLLHGFTQ